MKTTFNIPETLMAEARAVSRRRTKIGVVTEALEEFVRIRKLERLLDSARRREFRMDGADLDRMRHGR